MDINSQPCGLVANPVEKAKVQKNESEKKSDLLNGIAHELRTPLTNISLVGQTIGDESIPNEKKDYRRLSAMIAGESRRMSQQVDNIIQLLADRQMVNIDTLSGSAKEGATSALMPLKPTALDANIEALTEPKYKQVQIDLSVEVTEPVPVLKYGEYVIFSRGNISTIGGKAKSRKTFLIVLLASEYLENCQGNVLIIDTEMAKAHTYKTARRIHRLMDWDTNRNNNRLTVLSLREYAPNERVEIFSEAIKCLRPELVFLDGVRDLVKDFNNVEESTQTVGMLMKLSTDYDCHICSILHENKGNGQLRGHLGTEVINKSESVLSVANNGDTSTVEPIYTRNMPFDTFAIRVNDEGLPEYCDAPVKPAKSDELRQLFNDVVCDNTVSYSDLKKSLMDKGLTKATSERRIKSAIEIGVIIKNQRGDYYFPSGTDTSESILPF